MTSGLALRAEVAALFREQGRVLTVRVPSSGTYSPSTGAVTGGASTAYTGRGRIGDYLDKHIDGRNVLVGDRRCSFQPDDWANEPKIGNELLDGSNIYTVINVRARELDAVIMFTLQLRK